MGQYNQPHNPTMGDVFYSPSSPMTPDSEKESYSNAQDCEEMLKDNKALEDFLFTALLANLATVHKTKGQWHARGDPTEIAI